MRLLMLGCVVLALTACDNDDPCPYSQAAGTCGDAAERIIGAQGLCTVSRSVYDLTRECKTWDATFVDCWVACVNAATTCEEAWSCSKFPADGGCYCCGRDSDFPGC